MPARGLQQPSIALQIPPAAVLFRTGLTDWRDNGSRALGGRQVCIGQVTDELRRSQRLGADLAEGMPDPALYRSKKAARSFAAELCDNTFFDNTGVEHLNHMALRTLRFFPDVWVIDAFALTLGKCHCTAVADGRHYPALWPYWWETMLDGLQAARWA
jgi:hypothetical protein